MNFILSERSRCRFWQGVIASSGIGEKKVKLVLSRKQLNKLASEIKTSASCVLVESSLSWDGNLLQDFYGFDIAQLLRKEFLVKCPIIIFSPLKRCFFEKLRPSNSKYGLIDTAGCRILSFPFSAETLKSQLSESEPLSDAVWQDVVVRHCGLENEWRSISHQLGGYFSSPNYQEQLRRIRQMVDRWAESISRFAPERVDSLENFRNLLSLPPSAIDLKRLKRALEQLDQGLQDIKPTTNMSLSPGPYNQPPSRPPKGFAKILIADDEPQRFLIDSLRIQYGYQVIDQGFKLSQARDLLNDEKPDVVLSDLYFKKSSRPNETPDKSVGNKFIKYALSHPQYLQTDPRKPIVLVTSKASLRTETEIRAGAINCSGANRATDPAFIHSLIWAEAKKRGVSESQEIFGQETPPPLPSFKTNKDPVAGNKINIVVIENDSFWRDFVISAIEKAKSRLGESFSIGYQHFDNATDALNAMPLFAKSFAIDASNQSETKTIAIVDIRLPENREHAKRLRKVLQVGSEQLDTYDTVHGFNLIQGLSGYRYNIPLIVFSFEHSIAARKMVGGWGVPDDDFLAKGFDYEDSLVRALIRKIEKRTKYVIKRFEDERGHRRFWVNGVEITLPRELSRTLFTLLDLHQTSERNKFTITEIIEAKGNSVSEKSKKAVHDHIFRIRQLILKALQINRVYVNVRELIKTEEPLTGDEFTYQLNAEIMSLEEEGDYEADLQEYENSVCRVLVIENNSQTLAKIIRLLERSGYEVESAKTVKGAVQAATTFRPNIVSLDLQIPYTEKETWSSETIGEEVGGLEAWKQIRMALRTSSIGIVVPTVSTDKDYLVAQAAQMEIPIRNFVSKREVNWLNLFLKKIADEKRRVYLGEITDANRDINEPIVEILDGSDLPKGVLKLVVNDKGFTMKVSPVAKIIGLLLTDPKTLLSFEQIKRSHGGAEPVTKDDSKNWTKRIRTIINGKWLGGQVNGDLKKMAGKILESSSKGLRLNAQVIDSRRTRI
jgi:DNA-binding response OmpR family regulator